MNPFVEHLPWRIAALAGLIVGAVSFWAGDDLWACLLRMGGAFAFFWLGGWGLRAVMRSSMSDGSKTDPRRPGTYVDRTTPTMNVEDVARPADGKNPRGDENEQ